MKRLAVEVEREERNRGEHEAASFEPNGERLERGAGMAFERARVRPGPRMGVLSAPEMGLAARLVVEHELAIVEPDGATKACLKRGREHLGIGKIGSIDEGGQMMVDFGRRVPFQRPTRLVTAAGDRPAGGAMPQPGLADGELEGLAAARQRGDGKL